MIHRSIAWAVAVIAFVESAPGPLSVRAEEGEATKSMVVEYVKEKPQRGTGLGTKAYEPSDREAPYFKKLASSEIATGGLTGDYDITKKDKKYVGWFGIVR